MDGRPPVLLLVFGSSLIIALGTWTLMAMEVDVPPPPPPDPQAAKIAATKFRYRSTFFDALLSSDAVSYGLKGFETKSMLQPNRYSEEYRGRRQLSSPRARLNTKHLRIFTKIRKDWVRNDDQRFRIEHVALVIQNKTDKFLAYRVVTAVDNPKGCEGKGNIPHNALTIRPKETIERNECYYFKNQRLWVESVDVMEISELGYYYVGRILPLSIGVDQRVGRSHIVPGNAKLCRHVPAGEVKAAGDYGSRWAHVIDFYSRHNCDEYWFFSDYRRQEKEVDLLLPAVPPNLAK